LTTVLAGVGVVLAALYLLGFGALAVVAPARANGYLHGFASSVRVHVLELIARLAVGAAFVGYASQLRYSSTFHFVGVTLIVTTLALAVLPWRLHRRFAQRSVPAVRPHLPLMGIVSIAAGAFVLWAAAASAIG
jgi:uncharacterized protein YjeT (DUF2065 family)